MSDGQSEFKLQLNVKQVFWAGFIIGVLAAAALALVLVVSKGGSLSGIFSGSLDRNAPAAPSAAAPSAAAPAANDGAQVGTVAPVTKADHIRGDANSPIVLVEYSDFQCPFCSRFHPTMLQVVNEYKGKVAWVYRHFPLNSIHPDAQKAAEASECASEQGKFWEMADKMFEAQQTTGVGIAQLPTYAQQVGVKDMKKFNDCLSSGKYADRVAADEKTGEAAGVTGTPGTIILAKDGTKQLIPGALPFASIKSTIDALLK